MVLSSLSRADGRNTIFLLRDRRMMVEELHKRKGDERRQYLVECEKKVDAVHKVRRHELVVLH
jgi:hypothetical protein